MCGSQQRKTPACCPLAAQQLHHMEPLPHGCTHHGEEPRKAVPPVPDVRGLAKQHIEQQCGPHLPADGVGAVAESRAQRDSQPQAAPQG